MINLIIFVFASIGLTNIIVDGNIFAPVRGWLKKVLPPYIFAVFECYQCAGLWCGMICGAMLISHDPVVIFACGLAGSFLANFNSLVFTYLEARSIIDFPDSYQEEEK